MPSESSFTKLVLGNVGVLNLRRRGIHTHPLHEIGKLEECPQAFDISPFLKRRDVFLEENLIEIRKLFTQS
jgi:hypothetical protein